MTKPATHDAATMHIPGENSARTGRKQLPTCIQCTNFAHVSVREPLRLIEKASKWLPPGHNRCFTQQKPFSTTMTHLALLLVLLLAPQVASEALYQPYGNLSVGEIQGIEGRRTGIVLDGEVAALVKSGGMGLERSARYSEKLLQVSPSTIFPESAYIQGTSSLCKSDFHLDISLFTCIFVA